MTSNQRGAALAGATAAALAVLLAVAGGQQSPGPEAPQGHVVSGVAPAGSVATQFTALLDPSVLRLMGVDAGAQTYATGVICALPVDGGEDPGGRVIPGAIVVWGEPEGVGCDAGAPVLEMWLQGHPSAPWACACSSGASCQWRPPLYPSGLGDLAPAPLGVTLPAGSWSGAGCVRKSCVELAGVSSWSASCPLLYPDGGTP